MAKRISYGIAKNRKMDEDMFMDYANSIATVTGREVVVEVSNDNLPRRRLNLLLDGQKIGGWEYFPMLRHGRGFYHIAAAAGCSARAGKRVERCTQHSCRNSRFTASASAPATAAWASELFHVVD